MVYSIWGKTNAAGGAKVFSEKAFRRKGLVVWDARWNALSLRARLAFLDDVKGPVKPMTPGRPVTPPVVSVGKIPHEVLAELIAGGFVADPALSRSPGKVPVEEGLYDFATRVRALRRFHLLDPKGTGNLAKFVEYTCYASEALDPFHQVLERAGIHELVPIGDLARRHVAKHPWPTWVAESLKNRLAGPVLEAIHRLGGPVPIVQVPSLVKAPKDQARAALDELITHLAVFEDLDPKSLEVVVDLLPAVREGWAQADRPRERPPLVPVENLAEIGPEDAPVIDDLRGVLLEIASEPPQVRRDHGLFHKAIPRFVENLAPLPDWLAKLLGGTPEGRVDEALAWADDLELVQEVAQGTRALLRLTPKGERWLAAGVEEQHAELFRYVNAPASTSQFSYYNFGGVRFDDGDKAGGDAVFLGVNVLALRKIKGRPPSPWGLKPADYQPLRDALDRALAPLPVGVFHRVDHLITHLAFGEANPVRLGLPVDQVAVFWHGTPVPPIESEREEAGRLFLIGLLGARLIPLGAVRLGVDAEGHPAVARTPRLDVYFGRKAAAPSKAEAAALAAPTQVIVQPDFSLMVIGPNPAPAAELAPFCERATRGAGPGAQILKLTRDSVVKAVAHGMTPAEVVARLQSLATREIPPNVLKQVETWAAWVRHVEPSTLAVLRCPDRDTADRVLSALRKRAERLNDTLIAIDGAKLSAAERAKLREQGILVGPGDASTGAKSGKAKASRRPY